KVLSIKVFMDGSPLPAANTWSRSIIFLASRTVATSLGCSMRQLHLSATTLTSRHHNRSGPSLTESSSQGLNRHGHVRVVTSQNPGPFADRDEQPLTRPMGRRNRIDHGGQNTRRNVWDIRLQNQDNVWCLRIHKEHWLVLRPSDPGPHRTQITNRSCTAFSHSSLRRFDFTPLGHDQLILGTFQRITQRRQHLQTNAARWRCYQPIHLLARQLNASLGQ